VLERTWLPALLLPVALGLLTVLPEGGQVALAWERNSLVAGEWWRLWTGHAVHHGLPHALVNGVSLSLLGLWLVRGGGWRGRALLLAVALAAPLLSLGLLATAPGMGDYRGASGLVAMLMALAAMDAWRLARGAGQRGLAALVLVLLLGKVLGEALGVALPGSLPAGVHNAWQAHALGLLLGLGLGACGGRRRRLAPGSDMDGSAAMPPRTR